VFVWGQNTLLLLEPREHWKSSTGLSATGSATNTVFVRSPRAEESWTYVSCRRASPSTELQSGPVNFEQHPSLRHRAQCRTRTDSISLRQQHAPWSPGSQRHEKASVIVVGCRQSPTGKVVEYSCLRSKLWSRRRPRHGRAETSHEKACGALRESWA
jgi:hypothetical protein